jgi:hypothetical protein
MPADAGRYRQMTANGTRGGRDQTRASHAAHTTKAPTGAGAFVKLKSKN